MGRIFYTIFLVSRYFKYEGQRGWGFFVKRLIVAFASLGEIRTPYSWVALFLPRIHQLFFLNHTTEVIYSWVYLMLCKLYVLFLTSITLYIYAYICLVYETDIHHLKVLFFILIIRLNRSLLSCICSRIPYNMNRQLFQLTIMTKWSRWWTGY